MSKVLVIDDEALLRDSIAAYLEDDGYQVLTTSKAESALTKLPLFQPDVVVVDLRLEGASGEDFIKAASKISPQARYIIHTGCKDYHLPLEMLALGMGEHQILYKPVGDLSRLSGLIDHLLPNNSQAPTQA
jgi:DNA-binding NtrC family response regulator